MKRKGKLFLNNASKAFLSWFDVPKEEIWLKNQNYMHWKNVHKSGVLPPIYTTLTEGDKAKLKETGRFEVDIGDTAIGHAQALNKCKLFNAFDTVSKDEK